MAGAGDGTLLMSNNAMAQQQVTLPSAQPAVKFALCPTSEPQRDGAATRIQVIQPLQVQGKGQPLSFLVFEEDRNFQTLSTYSV